MIIDVAALINRVLALLVEPAKTWRIIANEPDSGRLLVTRYVLLLASVSAVFSFLGGLLGSNGFVFSLVFAVVRLGVAVGSVWLMGILINAMAPSFGTVRNDNAAFKLMAYASTPLWVVGLLAVIPQLSVLAVLLGVGYSLFLFHVGCPIVLRTPESRAWGFAFASICAWFGIMLVASLILYPLVALLFAPAAILGATAGNLPAT